MLNWLVWMSFSTIPLASNELSRRSMAACTAELAAATVSSLVETPMPSSAMSGATDTRPSPLTLIPSDPEPLLAWNDAAAPEAPDGDDDELPGSVAADESESQATSKSAASRPPTIRAAPIPLFTLTSPFALGLASATGQDPRYEEERQAGGQAYLQPAQHRLPRRAAVLGRQRVSLRLCEPFVSLGKRLLFGLAGSDVGADRRRSGGPFGGLRHE